MPSIFLRKKFHLWRSPPRALHPNSNFRLKIGWDPESVWNWNISYFLNFSTSGNLFFFLNQLWFSCIMHHGALGKFPLYRIFWLFLEVGKYLLEIYSLTDFTITRNICFPKKTFLIWFAQPKKCCSQCEPLGHSMQHSASFRIKTLYFSDLLSGWPI